MALSAFGAWNAVTVGWWGWLVSGVRYEHFDATVFPGEPASRDWDRIVTVLQYVPRANIDVTLGSDFVDRSYESGGFRQDDLTLACFMRS